MGFKLSRVFLGSRQAWLLLLALAVLLSAARILPAGAQDATPTPYPITLSLTGLAEATAGSTASYVLTKDGDREDGAIFVYPEFASFVGLTEMVGSAEFVGQQTDNSVRLGLGQGRVEVAIEIAIDAGTPPQAFSVHAYVPGTGTTSSNPVTTTIVATTSTPQPTPAAPATGVSGATSGPLWQRTWPWAVLIAVAGAALAASFVRRRIHG